MNPDACGPLPPALMASTSGDAWRRRYLHRLGIRHTGACPTRCCGEADVIQALASASPSSSSGITHRAAERAVPRELRGTGDFRVNFLRKLSYSKVWVPRAERPPKHQTVIIFDWDDTLLCTSFLQRYQGPRLTPMIASALRGIQGLTKQLLKLAVRFGHTFIITNAMQGWVERSAATYVPELLPILRAVPVISARSQYEPQFPDQVGQWKTQAFLEVQRNLDSRVITNLISLGDSSHDIAAAQSMGRLFSNVMTKTIKFAKNPSPEELVRQLEKLSAKFGQIVETARDLEIGLGRRRSVAARRG
uniref:Uncharacterized protein n=1 Tax=Alexandrium monilatum TaxID=311494 RepID=A0A7S4SGU7_9DINO|mmetsp:Transcript_102390/g.305805  ORF Transcript_102390/g.305805 Transcript_102390/m.305805 type:complete len:305 (+) Transcript_102390:2-916(+)